MASFIEAGKRGADSRSMNSSILNGASARLSETDHTPVQPRKLDLRLGKASRQGSALSNVVCTNRDQSSMCDYPTPVSATRTVLRSANANDATPIQVLTQ